MTVGLLGPTYQTQSPIGDVELVMNLYPEFTEPPAKGISQGVYYPTPGRTTFCDLGSGVCRALFAQDGRCFAVIGTQFVEIFFNGTSTVWGSVIADYYPATISSNGSAGNQLFVTSGGYGYIFSLTANTLTIISDADFLLPCAMGAYFDGYFLALQRDTRTFSASDLLNGSSWVSTSRGQKSITSDNIRAMVITERQIWLMGSRNTEMWVDSGTGAFPFEPIPGALIEHGIGSPFGYGHPGGGVYYVTESHEGARSAYAAHGASGLKRISTHAVEYAWRQYTTVEDAIGWEYMEQGHTFWVVNFPTGNATWVYDLTTGMWHQRGNWNGVTFDQDAALFHCYAFNKHLVGSSVGGVIYEQSLNYYDDAGETVRRVRRMRHMTNEGKRLFYGDLELNLQSGIGLPSGQGSDPLVMLRLSKNGGLSYGNERTVTAGAQGKYRNRSIFRRNGSAIDMVAELSVSDPVPWAWTECYWNINSGF